VATAYAPCEVSTVVRGTPVHVVQETEYPFRGAVEIQLSPGSPVAFPLKLRIPAWAAGTTIQVNGERQPEPIAGQFAQIERSWKRGDRVSIRFPLEPRAGRWFNNSVAVEWGPLVFSYAIGQEWLKLRDRGRTAAWPVYPT